MPSLSDSMRCFSRWVEDANRKAPTTPIGRYITQKGAKKKGINIKTQVDKLKNEEFSTDVKMGGTTPSPRAVSPPEARPRMVLGVQNPYLCSPITYENNNWTLDVIKLRPSSATPPHSPNKPTWAPGAVFESTTPKTSPTHARNISNASTLVEDNSPERTPTKATRDSVHVAELQAKVDALTSQLAVSEHAQILSQAKIASLLSQLSAAEKAHADSTATIRRQQEHLDHAKTSLHNRRLAVGNLQRDLRSRAAEIAALREDNGDGGKLAAFYETQKLEASKRLEAAHERAGAVELAYCRDKARAERARADEAAAVAARVHALGEEQFCRAEALRGELERVEAEAQRCFGAAKEWRRRCEFVHAEGEKEHGRAMHYKQQYETVLTKARARGIYVDEEAGRDRGATMRVVDNVVDRINSKLRGIVDDFCGEKDVEGVNLAASVLQAPSAAIFEPLSLDMQTDPEVEVDRQRVLDAGAEFIKRRARHMKYLGPNASEKQVMQAMEREEETAYFSRLRRGLFF